jgi:glycosyltransferase involved in cell wall biosynthesis
MARAMLKLIEDDGLKKSLIDKGRERVKDFSWEKTARETHKILIGS